MTTKSSPHVPAEDPETIEESEEADKLYNITSGVKSGNILKNDMCVAFAGERHER